MTKYEQTNTTLKISTLDNTESTTYLTFKTQSTANHHYNYIVERAEYYEQTLYSGDFRKFYKNTNKIEHINTVDKSINDITDSLKYEIINA